jgi:hypothetical protein
VSDVEPVTVPTEVADDVPEADAIEQARPVEEEPPGVSEVLDGSRADVPEADAIEQSEGLPGDQDERR